jgi:hypothetical protein
MTELERALYAIGRDLDVPETPALPSRVRARIEGRSRRRLALLVAVAAAVVAVGIAFAVPQARSSILRFFHLGAATVERVDTLPPAQQRPLAAGLGPPRSRAAAERIAGFPIVLPPFAHGAPTRYYARPGLIATTFRSHGKSILLAELSGRQLGFTKKFASPGTDVQPAEVSGAYSGLWLSGGRHVIVWATPSGGTREVATRLAGNVLIWETRLRTYRLEGGLSRSVAIALAGQITP